MCTVVVKLPLICDERASTVILTGILAWSRRTDHVGGDLVWVIVIRGRGTLGIGHGVHVNLHRQFQKEIGLEINSTICQGAYDLRLAFFWHLQELKESQCLSMRLA